MFARLWPWGKKIEIPLSLFSAQFCFFSHITLQHSNTSNGISENQSFRKKGLPSPIHEQVEMGKRVACDDTAWSFFTCDWRCEEKICKFASIWYSHAVHLSISVDALYLLLYTRQYKKTRAQLNCLRVIDCR